MIRVRGDVATKERPKVARKTRTATPSAKGSGPPMKPPVEVAGSAPKGEGSVLLVRGLPDDMKKRLEAERARRGLRSMNDVAVAVLDKGVPK